MHLLSFRGRFDRAILIQSPAFHPTFSCQWPDQSERAQFSHNSSGGAALSGIAIEPEVLSHPPR